jgi:hypothetical protein
MIRRYLTLVLTLSLTVSTLLKPQLGAHAQSKSVQASAGRITPESAANELGYEWPFASNIGPLSPSAHKTANEPVSSRATSQDSQAPEGDYGDAPDGSLAGYEVPFDQVVGRFPTLYHTTNSRVGGTGAHALLTDQETLGERVSREAGANNPNDSDGTGNLVDEDRYDDSLRIGFDENDPETPRTINVVLNVPRTAPEGARYVNVVADLNHDGVWQRFEQTDEWIVRNQQANIAPGTQSVAAQIPFDLIEQASPIWIRVVLSETPIDEAAFSSVGGWDGSGEFRSGEVEDHFLPVARAIASGFASARAAASACAFGSFTVAALAQAVAVANANANAIAVALAQAQANANAAAVAAAAAQASAQAAAAAAAQASSTAQQAIGITVSVPCVTLSANIQATASATATAAAAAAAAANAQAVAAAAAAAQAAAQAQAIAVALANAQSAAAALAQAFAFAQARAAACATAVAEARASAQAAALAIALGGRAAYAAAVARAVAVARAFVTVQVAVQAIALAFVNVQVAVVATARALAIAVAAAQAAAAAVAVAVAAATAAAAAAAAASAAAQTATSVLASVQATVDPNCAAQLCARCDRPVPVVPITVPVVPGQPIAIPIATAVPPQARSGNVKFFIVKQPPTLALTVDEKTGQVSGKLPDDAAGSYPVTVVAFEICRVAQVELTLVVPKK